MPKGRKVFKVQQQNTALNLKPTKRNWTDTPHTLLRPRPQSQFISMTSDIDSDISLLQQSVNHLEVVLASFEELAVSAPWSDLAVISIFCMGPRPKPFQSKIIR